MSQSTPTRARIITVDDRFDGLRTLDGELARCRV